MFLRNRVFVAVAFSSLLIFNIAIYPWMLDDSFISFRYAENLIAGHGLVYNPGERVEGYTCFLWVILLSSGHFLHISTVLFGRILGIAFSAATILLVFFSHRFLKSINPRIAAVAAVLLATAGAFSPWAISGMEVSLFSFLLLASLLYYLAHRNAFSFVNGMILALLLSGLSMTRPEGLLITVIIVADLLLLHRTISALSVSIIFFAIFGAYFYWRWQYYGYLLPNTFYAKVGSHSQQILRGIKYTFSFLLATSLLVVAAVVGVAKNTELRLMAAVLVMFTIYIVVVGGDIMPAFRFFAPLLPLLCILAAAGLQIRESLLLPGTACLIIFNLLIFRYHPQMLSYILSDTVAEDGKEVGLWLKQNASSASVIATNTGGSVAYYSRLRTIDMLGLNDVHIAHRKIAWLGIGPAGHEKGDGAYVLSRMPDYIQFGSSLGSRDPRFLSDQELSQLKGFYQNYELRYYSLPSGNQMLLYVKKGQ
ncbi:MAG: hypothetical protein C5B54_03345 [Acidobacteria bacterium]|nr:MAG: hypothetical protein C5B54_03345 [Acidobacteriota bacterium]